VLLFLEDFEQNLLAAALSRPVGWATNLLF